MGSKLLKPVFILACLIFAGVLQSGFIFLIIALLPSAVGYFIDNDPDKSTFKVILACNLAGTLPTLMPMLHAGIRMESFDVMSVMTNPHVWLFAYAAAGMGWCLIYLCRFIARFFVIIYFDYQTASLERFQKKLLEEWGDQIRQNSLAP